MQSQVMMLKQSNFANYQLWYSNLEVIYEIMKSSKNREVVVINPFKKNECIRMIRLNNAQQFSDIAKWINMDKRTWNFYASLATYKDGIPYQTFNMEERDNKAWNEEHWKHIESFDFLIDFDCDTHDEIGLFSDDVLMVSDFFKDIPHSIRFSGMGYHIIIPGAYMPKVTFDINQKFNYFDMLHDLLVALKRRFSDSIDTGCHDPRRVSKLPYSLALYEDDNYVCWPLRTKKELDNTHINYLSGAVLKDFEPIKNRGVPLLNLEQNSTVKPFKELLGTKWKRYIKNGN
jgi:hypothetical protein